ncbi:YbhB/YbcL family Raf kinase inhibitor-like protein [Candidatus Woesearchaeota archaeon]|nr:YbhB/YbcL family Raf kinase inhibitor-like protein [Candidatus Woesearchaeota archaeon]
MNIESSDLGETVPEKFTCDGEDISPSLNWSEAPEQTKSFAILVHDPDAPAGDWIHWMIYNIPKEKTSISQGEVPGEQVNNDFGKKEYRGPCPPSGTHRYFFIVYALDTETLEISDKEDFSKKMQEHSLAKAELISEYGR